MTYNAFKTVLMREGYTDTQAEALHKWGFESAKCVYESMRETIADSGISFHRFCVITGQDFVIENLEYLTMDSNGKIEWI